MSDHIPEDVQLSPEERSTLPDKVGNYISMLE